MMKKQVKNTRSATPQTDALRKRAVEVVRKNAARSPEKSQALSLEKTRKMLHELQVHQIELEMQNEEMRRTQAELDAARARYFDLYDLAPVGYCTVNEKGLILEANLTASTLFGIARGRLVKQLLTRFILKEDQDIYYLHRKKLFDTGEPQTCELRMVNKNGTQFWAHLVTAANDEDGIPVCRIVMSDITGIKQAESQKEAALELLKQSEAKYRLLADHIKDQVWLMDLNLKFTYISPSVEKLLGYTLEELKQLPLDKLLTTTSFKKAMDVFSMEMPRALEGTLPSSFKVLLEIECRHKDGRTLWIESTLSFIQDKCGKPLSIMGEGRDITERKRAEEKLRQSEEKYRTILENMQEGYFEVDLAGNFTFFNNTVSRVLGYSKDELIGMNYRRYTNEEELKKIFQAYNEVYKTGRPNKEFFSQITRKDGTKRYIEGSISLLNNSSGKPTGFRGIVRDVTERKLMEDKLRKEEQLFRALAEQSSDIIVLVNNERIITYENPAVEKVLGCKAEEKIGTSIFEDIHPDDIKLLTDSLYSLLSDINIPSRRSELRLRHVDGNWRTFDVMGSSLVQDNVVEAVLVNLRDITERKKAEEVLRESEHRFQELSIIDDLSQLYNSRHFYDQLKKEIERSNRYEQPLTLLLMDLDKFKDFNDAYGHVEGDYVLSRLGRVIKRCLREIDSAYRYGGEEFTIILPMTTSEEAMVTAKRIQTELRKEAFSPVLGQEVYVTVSIGLAQYKPKEEIKSFVHRVDQFMYKVKKGERGKICSDDGDVQ